MMADWAQLDEVNVLATAAEWAWPQALRSLFQPRGVSLLMAENPADLVNVIASRRIHTTIVDMDSPRADGVATIRIIRRDYPLMPCIMVTRTVDHGILDQALQLGVFGVVEKPVDMDILRGLLDRLFVKRYQSNVFSQ